MKFKWALAGIFLAASGQASTYPWADLARGPVVGMIAALRPQLDADHPCTGEMAALWGTSVNFDEKAKAEIVSPKTVAALHGRLGIELPNAPYVHAGVTHTYGYLLSLLETPFGFKRDRWISGKSEEALGLPPNSLNPNSMRKGTSLLGNATWALAKIALTDSPRFETRIAKASCSVAPAVRKWKPRGRWTRITETASDGKGFWEIRTDLTERYLVYSIRGPRDGEGARLITGFPIEPAFGEALIRDAEAKAKLESTPILTRYNAFIPSWPAEGVPGKVRVSSKDIKP